MSFRLSFLVSLFVGMASLMAGPPNVVLIIVDDLGWTDLGCFGSTYYETPHIDRLASGGMRFVNGRSCGPNCAPTRAALWSGQYSPRTGVYNVPNPGQDYEVSQAPLWRVENVRWLAVEKFTLAEAMQAAGYTTGLFGKWHLGNQQFHPSNQGFDEAIITAGKHYGFVTDPAYTVSSNIYLTEWLTDRAVGFIEDHQSEPFFLVLDHFAPHGPLEAPTNLIAYFEAKSPSTTHSNAVYAAMISSVDESVGRVVDKLEELNLSTNTLVVFFSDNGGVSGTTENAPLRGGKGTLYEGGIRVPYIFNLPGVIRTNATTREPIVTLDLYPTILDICEIAPPEGLDGISAVPALLSFQECQRSLYWHFPGYLQWSAAAGWNTTPRGAVIRGEWKLIETFETGGVELYNLTDDISESNNLASEMPWMVDALRNDLTTWRTNTSAPMPVVNVWSNSAPVIITHPVNISSQSGKLVTFTVAPAGVAPFTYQWLHHGTNVTGGTKQWCTRMASVAQSGPYSVIVSNALGQTTSITATLNLLP